VRASIQFVTAELTRCCQIALRGTNGQVVTADVIAVTSMREKHVKMEDGELCRDITGRILSTLNRLMGRNAVVKKGGGRMRDGNSEGPIALCGSHTCQLTVRYGTMPFVIESPGSART
jgi:hypothetical protein